MFGINAPELIVLGFMGVGPTELIILGIIGVLLFGRRLPEVGRSLGKSIIEFKRGINGIEDEIDSATTARRTTAVSHDVADDRAEATAPKFDPPAEEPKVESAQT